MTLLSRFSRRPGGHLSRRANPQTRPANRRRLLASIERLERLVMPTAFTVTTVADDGPGSLRQAILDSNADTAATNTISFDIDGTGMQTIEIPSILTVTAPVIIDGTTQPGYDGSPVVALHGDPLNTGISGLIVEGGNTTVKGLMFYGFSLNALELRVLGGNTVSDNQFGAFVPMDSGDSNGQFGVVTTSGQNSILHNVFSSNTVAAVEINSVAATDNLVRGNFIGTDATGSVGFHRQGSGVSIEGASRNTIGGTSPGDANIISANLYGISISDASGNIIQGNLIGTDATGTKALANTVFGIYLSNSPENTIGGTAAGAGNVISGNGLRGIYILGAGSSANVIQGNLIGTDKSGTTALGNRLGIHILSLASNNLIGGTLPGAGNVISGNQGAGVLIDGWGASGNVLQGNKIGTDITGTIALANVSSGVGIATSASGNTIGGTAPGSGNLISGNEESGIVVTGTGNLIQGNKIGTDVSGTFAMPNGKDGITIYGGVAGNTVGGAVAGAGNLISGNIGNGVILSGRSTFINLIQGNRIGTDVSGTFAVPNGGHGVLLDDLAFRNTVGGTAAGAGNVISGNGGDGVRISDVDTSDNLIAGNFIGTDETGTTALGNGGNGVSVFAGTSANTIGGTTPNAGNVVSGNKANGVSITDAGTSDNLVQGNLIGTDLSGTKRLANDGVGILINIAASENTIGGAAAGAGNLISGNTSGGVLILDAGTSANLIQGNKIGTDLSGSTFLPNLEDGVLIEGGASGNTIGGTAAGAGNLISGNVGAGVDIRNAGTSGNLVQGNRIGTDATGMSAIPNGRNGAIIYNQATGNTIGGTAAGAGNLISGNFRVGLAIADAGTSNNVALGNRIGTDVSGTAAVPNEEGGVSIFAGASANTIGGRAAGAGNVISGNFDAGLAISGAGTSSNLVLGNLIGTDLSGSFAVPNEAPGITIYAGASGNTVGGATPGAGNVVSGNGRIGFEISSVQTTGNVIRGNLIGTNKSGTAAIGNSAGLILFGQASGNTIGGATLGEANIIAGNLNQGVLIADQGTKNNLIVGNTIGTTDPSAAGVLGNGSDGVFLYNGAGQNTIGGAGIGAGNRISGNRGNGVTFIDEHTTNNVLIGNVIGEGVGNGLAGVSVVNKATSNTIGGTAPGEGNRIVDNGGAGVEVIAPGINGTQILGNVLVDNGMSAARPSISIQFASAVNISGNIISGGGSDGISLASSGSSILAANVINGAVGAGIRVWGLSAADLIGVPGAGNTVTRNQGGGILLIGDDVTGARVQGNFIGSNAASVAAQSAGPASLGNGGDGLELGGHDNTVGGLDSGMANAIANNTGAGVRITSNGPAITLLSNLVFGNHAAPNIVLPTPAASLPPTLTEVVSVPGGTRVKGTLPASGGQAGVYVVQFFSINPATGFETLQGTTFATGGADFEATLGPIPVGQVLLAITALNPQRNSSEYSAGLPVSAVANIVTGTSVVTAAPTVGQPLVFAVAVVNAGPSSATGVTLIFNVPAGATLSSVVVSTPSGTGTYATSGGQIIASIGDLAPSAAAQVVITVTPQVAGSLNATAGAFAAQADPDTGHNFSSASASVQPPPVSPTSAQRETQTINRRKQVVVGVHYSGPLGPPGAGPVSFYALRSAGRDGRFGTKDDQVVRLRAAQLAPSGSEVILTPVKPLPRKPLQLRVIAGALRDSFGRPLVGNQANGDWLGSF